MASKNYYSLFVKQDGQWSHEFGAFDRKDVLFEQDDWARGYDDNQKRYKKDTLVHTWATCPGDAEIKAKTAELNAA